MDMMTLLTVNGQDEIATLFRLWHTSSRPSVLGSAFRDTRWSQDVVLDVARRTNTRMSIESESDKYAYVSLFPPQIARRLRTVRLAGGER